jgi:TM2 domain-containing membrane protein YozV
MFETPAHWLRDCPVDQLASSHAGGILSATIVLRSHNSAVHLIRRSFFSYFSRVFYTPDQAPKFYKNPALATILSFFFSGLGQIYNGEIGKGIVFIVLYGISLALMLIVIGFITTPILWIWVWIWGMVDANSSAKRINEVLARQ